MSLLELTPEKNLRDPARDNAAARLAATTPLLIMAVYMYGLRPLVLCAVAAVTAVLCDVLGSAMRQRKWVPADLSSPLFAVLLVCLMPATISYNIVIVATLTAILVGKHLFGGSKCYPFHPTALGYMVAVVSWPRQMLSFPAPFTYPGYQNLPAFVPVEAPAATLQLAGLPNLSGINVLLGNFAGPLGASVTLVVLASGLLLLAVRRFDLVTALSFAGAAAAVLHFFPRFSGVEESALMGTEAMVCGLAFGAVFLLQDEVTAPHGFLTRILYGALVGVLTVVYQYYSSYPYGICFGVLWGNALSGFLEHVDGSVRAKLASVFRRKTSQKGEQTV